MSKPILIGITGVAGAGKSTIARMLQADYGYTIVKFAGALKGMCRAVGLAEREIEGDLKEQPMELLCGKSPREFMQLLGTEFARELIGEQFWVNIAMQSAHKVIDCGGLVVLDDCRFENEARAIRDAGGVIIKVLREGYGPVNGHVSDSVDIEPDITVYNHADMSMLADAVGLTMAFLTDIEAVDLALEG